MGRFTVQHFRRWAAAGALVGVLGITSLGSVGTGSAQLGTDRDCDDNAVMRCGALSAAELKNKYRDNQAGNTQQIFNEFGIMNEAALDGMVEGRVTSQNEIFVGNDRVAINAMTAGRQQINRRGGTSTPIAGGAAFKRAPSVSFADPNGSLRAMVKMENGVFKYAVITACGNPVTAQPVTTPPPPVQPPKRSDFEVTKDVRNIDPTPWVQDVDAKRGDHLEYRVIIRNTGETSLENVMVRDSLPSGIGFVGDSLRVNDRQVAGNPTGLAVNIGTIAVGGSATVVYEAVVGNDAEACGANRLRNVARVRPEGLPEKQDDATVRVCVPQVQAKVTPPPAKFVPAEPVVTKQVPAELPKTGGVSEIVSVLFVAFTAGGALARQVFVTYRAKGSLR